VTDDMLVSGGFATVQPDSQLSINAVEGYPLEDFSAENVRNQISEAQKIASGSGSEQDKAEANIELEVSEVREHMVCAEQIG
jgi:F-type H+-transporting ATPase subunit delta